MGVDRFLVVTFNRLFIIHYQQIDNSMHIIRKKKKHNKRVAFTVYIPVEVIKQYKAVAVKAGTSPNKIASVVLENSARKLKVV